jgi:hypothetical protein
VLFEEYLVCIASLERDAHEKLRRTKGQTSGHFLLRDFCLLLNILAKLFAEYGKGQKR